MVDCLLLLLPLVQKGARFANQRIERGAEGELGENPIENSVLPQHFTLFGLERYSFYRGRVSALYLERALFFLGLANGYSVLVHISLSS